MQTISDKADDKDKCECIKNSNLCRPERFAIFKRLFSFESFQDRYGKSWKSLSLLTMCAQWNSPLGRSRNNEQSVTGNTRRHYQLNYQLELIRTAAWNEFGCGPASFFVPEYSCERTRFCTAARAFELQGTKESWCLPFTASQIYSYERNSWESLGFQSRGHRNPPHVLHKCL